jgi:hypothetical protein
MADWRKDPATENQLVTLERLGGKPHPNMTKGEASDLIDHYASEKKTYRR